jgi:hypothetical protein
MTLSRIQELESLGFGLGFEWNCYDVAWDDRLSELAEYRKIHGHCNVPRSYSKNTQLANWVMHQRKQYKLHSEGKTSAMTLSRIQELESLGFGWDSQGAGWEDRLSELSEYRKIHGHCKVPRGYSENTKLVNWVRTQRKNYRFHLEGNKTPMTALRIQALESLGFEWDSRGTAWADRLSELADYRKIHGHCNVPQGYSEKTQLGEWVGTQRRQYKLRLEGKTSHMTLPRVQELESLGFEWDRFGGPWDDHLSELADYRK